MQVNLDLSQVNGELSSFQIVPTGVYDLTVTNAEWKENSAKTGSFYSLSLRVTSGIHEGKTFCQNLNVVNSNPKAVEIGLQVIKQILTEINHPNPNLLGNLNEFVNGNSFRGNVELEAYNTTNGGVGYSSSLKKVVSKEISLFDGTVEEKSKPATKTSAPSAPSAPMSPPVSAPVSGPSVPSAPAPSSQKTPPWQK